MCKLLPAGHTVEWVGGFVTGALGHAWLEVDGQLFDPTAEPWRAAPEYTETERFDASELGANGWPR